MENILGEDEVLSVHVLHDNFQEAQEIAGKMGLTVLGVKQNFFDGSIDAGAILIAVSTSTIPIAAKFLLEMKKISKSLKVKYKHFEVTGIHIEELPTVIKEIRRLVEKG